MPYRLVKGEFRLTYQGERRVGSRPDGDSLWFKPNRPANLNNIGHRDAELNPGGFAQLRFEGIDALELHYPGSDHQHAGSAVAARDYLLGRVGFSNITYATNADIPTCVQTYTPVSVRGYILTRAIDPYGRPVAFVYVGSGSESDGDDRVFLTVARLDQSLNAHLMRQGHVYPGYYTPREINGEMVGGLPWDLRDRLTEHAISAWNYNRGVWPVDDSRNNPQIRNRERLMQLAVWPKLYRRMANYFRDGNTGLGNFVSWLNDPEHRRTRNDQVLILPLGEIQNLTDTFTVTGNRINMLYWPEELVIVPR